MTASLPVHCRSIGKLLIANRGEIALRIMRTARAMGIRCVAVHSTADRDAAHVAAADEAVCIGEAAPLASYLNIEAILEAARKTGADAIHPGYGFLSENADFASACLDVGLVFVGPPPHAIAAMGDKADAKRFMRDAGLPCVPGYDGDDQDARTLAWEAERVGYPLIIKATGGGGGRGMRVVESSDAFAAALESARSEARNAFGNDRVLIERLVRHARHIEIQVLVDRHGHGVHFGERDCSVQRRHQKVIEEAPAPGLDPAQRDQLGAAAVAAAVSLGYEGVGTFEFLLEPDGRQWFMEMNTRLQVEHPVTEFVCGTDLVAWQLRVAMGEPLGLTQHDVVYAGHAIEVRLCAEDETQDFLPQSGRISRWQAPTGVRVETGVHDGTDITPFYDSMFAKIIAGGRTREEARRRLVAALRATVCFGVATNRQALIRCLEHPAFVAGGVDTGFMMEHGDALTGVARPASSLHVALASVWSVAGGEAACASARSSMVHLRDAAGTVHLVQVQPAAGRFLVSYQGRELIVDTRCGSRASMRVEVDGVARSVQALREGPTVHVQCDGVAETFVDVTYLPAPPGGAEDTGRIRAISNGRVARIFVKDGQRVTAGDPVLTIEAMKMEHLHVASQDGRVKQVAVTEGDLVPTGRMLVELADVAE